MKIQVLKAIGITFRVMAGLALMAGGIAIMVYAGSSFNTHSSQAVQWIRYIGLGLMVACIGGLVVIGGPPKRKSIWQ